MRIIEVLCESRKEFTTLIFFCLRLDRVESGRFPGSENFCTMKVFTILVIIMTLIMTMDRSLSKMLCKEEWCTSPDGKGGTDCWAGPRKYDSKTPERCTCSTGQAVMTGDKLPVLGTWYYRYNCCLQTENEVVSGDICGDNTCSESYCESSDGKGGKDCWVTKTETCPCSKGRPKIVDGAEMVIGGNNYYQYLCCTGDAPDIGSSEYCAADQPTSHSTDLSCSPEYCTSPGADGQPDCWAGSKQEPCTCSQGRAIETGNHVYYKGTKYYEYTCCSGADSDDAYSDEECGDFEGGGGLAVALIVLMIGCGCGCCISAIVYCFYKKQRKLSATEGPPIAAGAVVEMTASPYSNPKGLSAPGGGAVCLSTHPVRALLKGILWGEVIIIIMILSAMMSLFVLRMKLDFLVNKV